MHSPVTVHGHVTERFEPVRDAFQASFDAGEEGGAGFAFYVDGQKVVDLVGGYADKTGTVPFDHQTLVPVFSSTKALAALMVARLVDQGRLSYDQPVADVWPEFAANGKGALTIAQALSHQAGVPGFAEPMDVALWFDWDAICAKIAAAEPMWPPGTASGYHASTYGFIAGEIFRRVDGRTLGTALREDVAGPLDLDFWIGLPESEDHRVADLERPRSLPNFGAVNEPRKVAFMTRWAAPGPRDSAEWRRAELPSSNGHATADSFARLMSALAGDGTLGGQTVLSPATIAQASRQRIKGPDLVMPYDMSWGAGFMRNAGLDMYGPGQATFGHSGWGGSCLFADPEGRISGAYVMTRQSAMLLGDPRPRRLIETAYACL